VVLLAFVLYILAFGGAFSWATRKWRIFYGLGEPARESFISCLWVHLLACIWTYLIEAKTCLTGQVLKGCEYFAVVFW
jgi:hypothetical protein